ncbi:MAG: hypothetical protein KBG28_25360 [Kofleriaceae bacterium]|jgi:hypothetical protein|nr:hypothetical protein [Kofleriaceae bacterium]MBP9207323.1 hypothetical protein [Kofleriaceae bacterium]
MVWEPFLLAIALGLTVSAGIYFALLWPGVEPDDDEHDPDPPAHGPGGADTPRPGTGT